MSEATEQIRADFDRLAALQALLGDGGWSVNSHYHPLLLQHIPARCASALDVGCGTGEFTRRLAARAERVVGIDLSPEMIRIARGRSAECPRIEYRVGDVMAVDLPAGEFDCIASIATLHHMPLRDILLRLKDALSPGGVLAALDLYKAERIGVRDAAAMAANIWLRLIHTGRLRPPRRLREAWDAHSRHDIFPTMRAVRDLCADILPGARVTQHLMWRYSIIWRKPERPAAA